MSTISASTTSNTAFKVTSDTTGTLVFQTGAVPTTAISIDASQAVGIGTTSPGQKLTVAGGSVLLDNSQYYYGKSAAGSAVRLLGVNSGNVNYVGAIDSGPTEVNFGAASTITLQAWNISGSEAMRLNSTGLGIGTASPAAKLHVVGDSLSNTFKLIANTAVSGSDATIFRPADNTMAFSTNGSERARIDSSGNLGIGTTTLDPSSRITIDPDSGDFAIAMTEPTGDTATYGYLKSGHFTNGAFIGTTAGSNTASDILRFGTGGTERARITSAGNLQVQNGKLVVSAGSGDSYAANLSCAYNFPTIDTYLDSYAGASYSGQIMFRTNSGGGAMSERARIDSSGRFGIGTDSNALTNVLTLYRTGSTQSAMAAGNSNTGLNGTLFGVDTAGNGIINQTQALATIFSTSSTERARITSGGVFYLNTTASSYGGAQARMDVNGGSTAGMVVTTSAGTSYANIYVHNTATSGNNVFVDFGTEGTWTSRGSITYNRAGGLVAYNTTSDYRAKDILGLVQNSGATIDALKVYEGQMKGATQSRPMLVAHEAQEHAPYAVTGEKDAVNEDGTPKYQQMDVSALVPLLLAELQSVRARLAALESK